MSFQTYMIFFLMWSKKEEILKNVLAVFVHGISQWGPKQHLTLIDGQKKTLLCSTEKTVS